jgi:hypothetical protein
MKKLVDSLAVLLIVFDYLCFVFVCMVLFVTLLQACLRMLLNQVTVVSRACCRDTRVPKSVWVQHLLTDANPAFLCWTRIE